MAEAPRPHHLFSDLQLSLGKHTRLHRLLYDHGPGGGTMMMLPLDQGLEHGPRDFYANPPSADPEYVVRLARIGGFSGIVLQYGLAHKYLRDVAGRQIGPQPDRDVAVLRLDDHRVFGIRRRLLGLRASGGCEDGSGEREPGEDATEGVHAY